MARSKASSKTNDDDDSFDNGKSDKRKFNRGASQRRSYTKEEKLSVISMKDGGMSYDEISRQTGFSRVNMEKWCSVKGREAIMAKVNKASVQLDDAAYRAEDSPQKKTKQEILTSMHVPVPTSSHSPKQSNQKDQKHANTSSNEVNSSSSRPSRHNQTVVIPVSQQPIQPGTANSFQSSGEDNDDASDEECEDIRSDPHLLRLVMKEQRQTQQQRADRQSGSSSALPSAQASTANKRKQRGESAAVVIPPADTGYFLHQHKPDPVSAMVPKAVLNREFVRVNHSNYASDITMSISDTMLKPDFSALGDQKSGGFDMTTTQQATRPVLSNTKFFRLLREERKKQSKAEGGVLSQEGSVDGSGHSSVAPVRTERLKTKRRVLEVLCNSDSEQEKEDSAMLMLLGE